MKKRERFKLGFRRNEGKEEGEEVSLDMITTVVGAKKMRNAGGFALV